MSRLLISLSVVLLAACAAESPDGAVADAPVIPDAAPIDLDDPRTCAPCHQQVVDEWTESMHARSHQDSDPIFSAMRAMRMEKQGEDVALKCAKCHSPRDPLQPTSTAAKNGVSCATCHATIGTIEGKMGVDGLVMGEPAVLRGPNDIAPKTSPAHGTGPAAPHLVDGRSVCLVCHGEMTTPGGAPACTTGPEHAASAGDKSCTDCHMPRVEGPSGVVSTRADHGSHAFAGPHRAWYQDDPSLLQSAIQLTATLQGDTLSAELTNVSGHAFPTGYPGRMAAVVAAGFDAAGSEVWKSGSDDPTKLLRKVYVDADGKPTMPPFSVRLETDSRLTPDEVRSLSWEVPAEVIRAEVQVVFRLMPPPAAEKMGLADALEATPRRIATAEATR